MDEPIGGMTPWPDLRQNIIKDESKVAFVLEKLTNAEVFQNSVGR